MYLALDHRYDFLFVSWPFASDDIPREHVVGVDKERSLVYLSPDILVTGPGRVAVPGDALTNADLAVLPVRGGAVVRRPQSRACATALLPSSERDLVPQAAFLTSPDAPIGQTAARSPLVNRHAVIGGGSGLGSEWVANDDN